MVRVCCVLLVREVVAVLRFFSSAYCERNVPLPIISDTDQNAFGRPRPCAAHRLARLTQYSRRLSIHVRFHICMHNQNQYTCVPHTDTWFLSRDPRSPPRTHTRSRLPLHTSRRSRFSIAQCLLGELDSSPADSLDGANEMRMLE